MLRRAVQCRAGLLCYGVAAQVLLGLGLGFLLLLLGRRRRARAVR